jgi:hypothetical protein
MSIASSTMVAAEEGTQVMGPITPSRSVVSVQEARSFYVRPIMWVGVKWSDPRPADLGPTKITAVVSAMFDLLPVDR